MIGKCDREGLAYWLILVLMSWYSMVDEVGCQMDGRVDGMIICIKEGLEVSFRTRDKVHG